MARRILLPLVIVAASTLLGGCPQHVEKLIDEALPPENYRPVYLTSGVTYADLLKEKGVTIGSGADALPAGATGVTDSIRAARAAASGAEAQVDTASRSITGASGRRTGESDAGRDAGAEGAAASESATSTAGKSATGTRTGESGAVATGAGAGSSDTSRNGTDAAGRGATGTRTGESGTPRTGMETSATSASSSAGLAVEIRNVDDRRYPDLVELRAFVYDASGRFVMGLAPPHFAGSGTYRDYWRTLVDSCAGEAVTIDSFDVVEMREDRREPLAIAYALDHSGSMGEMRTLRLREAIQRTMRLIRRGDRVAILTFTQHTNVEIPLTGDSGIFRNFRGRDLSTYGGGTALYDGALEAIEQIAAAPATHRRSLIIFSDGADNDSDSSLAAVHRAAREHRVTVYTIAYGQAEEEPLRDLATYTGGKMYRIYSTKEFPFVFADIYRRMNNYYRITYRAPECRGIHTATATLAIPELTHERMAASGIYDQSVFTPFTEVGDITFANIEFDFDKATIRPESMSFINDVASSMKRYPRMVVEVRGHTDDRGTDEYNLDLSKRRAQAVADALVANGVAASRLRVEGYGESRPLVVNDTEPNRTRNRRTEFVILER